MKYKYELLNYWNDQDDLYVNYRFYIEYIYILAILNIDYIYNLPINIDRINKYG